MMKCHTGDAVAATSEDFRLIGVGILWDGVGVLLVCKVGFGRLLEGFVGMQDILMDVGIPRP